VRQQRELRAAALGPPRLVGTDSEPRVESSSLLQRLDVAPQHKLLLRPDGGLRRCIAWRRSEAAGTVSRSTDDLPERFDETVPRRALPLERRPEHLHSVSRRPEQLSQTSQAVVSPPCWLAGERLRCTGRLVDHKTRQDVLADTILRFVILADGGRVVRFLNADGLASREL